MKRLRWLFIALPLTVILGVALVLLTGRTADSREEIVITLPYNENIREADTNYYKLWLEEQTGLSITFNVAPEAYSPEYLRSMFASGYVKSDAFFSMLDGGDYAEWNAVIQEFGEKGYILPLNEYIDKSEHMNKVFAEFTDYDLRDAMTSDDGNIYYMPGFDPSIAESYYQVMWLNESWIKKLGLKIPQTTTDFRAMLEAFRDGDPNGNGLQDEIPLAGSSDTTGERIYNFIINAFVYNDPLNSRLFVEEGAVRFAPVTDEWREAMRYLNDLHANGLIDPFSYKHNVLTALANDPRDLLGGFASQSITDILFQLNPELINDFTHVVPLAGPDGERNAMVRTPLPRPGGVITSACKNPEAVFKLFDLMMSENAFLIGRYGEKGIDWIEGGITDIDFYGNSAAVRVVNQLQNRVQNKHICEIGPFYAYPKYADRVNFSGLEADQEYVNAKAYRTYEEYKPVGSIRIIGGSEELRTLRKSIDAYTEESLRAFITGAANPFDDATWATHVLKYQELGIERLIELVTEELP